MKFSINFLLGLTLLIALALATVRLGRVVVIREVECFLEKPFEKHFATGAPLPSLHAIKKEIRDCEKILSGFGVPLNSTRFREDISRADAEPALYFSDHKVQQLCLAINADNLDEMKRLIAKGVNLNAQGDGGITPLIWAFAQKRPEAFRLLLKHKADPDLRLSDRIHMHGVYSNSDDSVFTLCARFDWVTRQFLRDAIPFSKNINQRSAKGDTLLMTFARPLNMSFHFDTVSCDALLSAGAELNAGSNSNTSIHWPCIALG